MATFEQKIARIKEIAAFALMKSDIKTMCLDRLPKCEQDITKLLAHHAQDIVLDTIYYETTHHPA